MLDGDLTGDTPRLDMGAHEFCNVLLGVGGDATPGGALTVTSWATPGIVAGVLLVGLDHPAGTPLLNFGPAYIDLLGPFGTFTWPTNGTVMVPVPPTLAVASEAAFQLLGLGTAFPSGNLSNSVVVRIE